jgi:hypothetical protein
MKREHRYRITLEHLAAPKESVALHPPLSFETTNHDDVFMIIQRSRAKGVFDADTAAALALGLKLFTEVMLKHRSNALFSEIRGPMRDFIGRFKALGHSGVAKPVLAVDRRIIGDDRLPRSRMLSGNGSVTQLIGTSPSCLLDR